MNAAQRQIIIQRDGFACVTCRLVGTVCPYRGSGDEPCKLPSPTLKPVAYWRLDANRPAYMRLQVDHIVGRVGGVEVTEAWENVVALCACCHAAKAKVRDMEIAYATTFKGMETQEYLAALAQEADAAPKRKASKAKARSAAYQRAKRKAGGTPLSKNKDRKPNVKAKPRASGTKYASQKWAPFANLPVLNGNSQPPSP